MKKNVKILVAAAVVVLAITVIGTGIVAAQSPAVRSRFFPSSRMGQTGSYGGMMSGATHSEMMNGKTHDQMMGGTGTDGEDYSWMDQMHAWMSASGGMHAIVWNGLAGALGLTPDELNAELSSGKTITQIAGDKGIQKEQLAKKLESLVKAGLDKAVADQKITQEQADQMLQHMGGNYLWMLDHMSSGDPASSRNAIWKSSLYRDRLHILR